MSDEVSDRKHRKSQTKFRINGAMNEPPNLLEGLVLFLSAPACWWLIWRFRGRSERARSWIPRDASEEHVRFFIMPMFALSAFTYGLQFPLAVIDSDWLWMIFGLTFLPATFIAMVMCPVYITLGEHVPTPRWLIPRWSYDPKKGHPFHIKIYKVRRESDR